MSEVTPKSSAKKGFSAPVLKENNTATENSNEKKELKKIKVERNTAPETSGEKKGLKKTKTKKENKPENLGEKKSTESENKLKKPQVSLTDSQYEDIFSAVLSSHGRDTSQQNTPLEEFSEPSERLLVHTPKSNKGGSLKSEKKKIPDPVTPSRQATESFPKTPTKEKTQPEPPKTPIDSTPSKQKAPASPWGTHFSKHSSQASVILKEYHESQSSLLNTSGLMSPDTSNSEEEGEVLSQRSVRQLSQGSGYGSQTTYFQLQSTDQRSRLEELQKLRNVGVWVYCCRASCQKQRYLADITDPQDVPDVWFCHMNPDSRYNSCVKPEQPISEEEEEDMIYNEFTAGSVVWARVAGYPWWPAMVDDDPDLEQYYWLDDDFATVRMTRGIDFSRRIMVAKEQATDALTLNSYQRLQIYSFIARYKGPINTSESQANKTIKKYKLKGKTRQKSSEKKNLMKKEKNKMNGENMGAKSTKLNKENGGSIKRKQKNNNNSTQPLSKKCKIGGNEKIKSKSNGNQITDQNNKLKKCSKKVGEECEKETDSYIVNTEVLPQGNEAILYGNITESKEEISNAQQINTKSDTLNSEHQDMEMDDFVQNKKLSQTEEKPLGKDNAIELEENDMNIRSDKINSTEHMDDSETMLEDLSEKSKLSSRSRLNSRDPRNNKSNELKQREECVSRGASTFHEEIDPEDSVVYPTLEENLSQKSKSSSKCRQKFNSESRCVETHEQRLSQGTIADFFEESEDAVVPGTDLSQGSLPFEE